MFEYVSNHTLRTNPSLSLLRTLISSYPDFHTVKNQHLETLLHQSVVYNCTNVGMLLANKCTPSQLESFV